MGVDGFGTLREQFLVHIGIERGLAKATVSAYESDLNKYVAWLQTHGITKPDDIAKQDVEDYIAALDADGESARSKARRLASIHEFHRFALAQHAVSADVAASVKAPKGASVLPDVLSVDEVSRLLDAAAVGGSTDPVVLRDKALLEFMYATGCRVSEAVGTNLDDIDLEEKVVRLMGKGSKQRLVPEQARQTHLTPIGMGNRQNSGGAGRHHQAAASAYAAAFVRHSSDSGRCGRAHRTGTAGPCQRHHHADIYARESRGSDRNISHRASQSALAAMRRIVSAYWRGAMW